MKEKQSFPHQKHHPIRDRIGREALATIMPPFPMPEIAAIGDFHAFLDSIKECGTGGVIFYNHATKGGPLAIAKVLATMSPVDMPVMFPVSQHNKNGALDWVVSKSNGNFQYLVTSATREKYENKGKSLPSVKEQAAMVTGYLNVAADTITAGGLVVVDPQATRTATLQVPEEPVVAKLLKGLKRKGVLLSDVAGICVGVSSHKDLASASTGGINPFKRLDFRFGSQFTLNDVSDQDFVMTQLGLLVPPAMQGAYTSRDENFKLPNDSHPTKPHRIEIFRRK